MVGLGQQSAPKQLIYEVPSHVVPVNNKVGAGLANRLLGQSLILSRIWDTSIFLQSCEESLARPLEECNETI